VTPDDAAPAPGARLLELVAVMDRLRRSCPWDQEQTHRSLARYLVEETYEALEAIESGDGEHLREELGDLLLQVVFHARIAEEDPSLPWGIDDVAGGIVDKLVRRHPHVFGSMVLASADEVASSWERLKAEEKRRPSALDGVPPALPALTLAAKLVDRAQRAGLGAAIAAPADEPAGVGEALLDLVVDASRAGVDPEQALRDTLRRLAQRVRAAETAR
jgi:XTP/dITP diphosphohydrolase